MTTEQDKRFDELFKFTVSSHERLVSLIELGNQRHEKAHEEIRQDIARINERLDDHDKRFDNVDERFNRIDEKFNRIDERFSRIDERFSRIDERFSRIDERFDRVEKNQISTFEILSDMAASISDSRLAKKARAKAAALKKTLA